MEEMENRGFRVGIDWKIENYRGKELLYSDPMSQFMLEDFNKFRKLIAESTFSNFKYDGPSIYPEHDDKYLAECLQLLKRKEAKLVGTSVEEEQMRLAVRGS